MIVFYFDDLILNPVNVDIFSENKQNKAGPGPFTKVFY